MNQRNASMTVIGAGSYGTALAITLARNGHEVVLWGHDPEHIATLERDRCNAAFLPDVPFPDTLHLESDLATALAASRNILVVVPSHVFGEVLRQIKPLMRPDARLVWATKGLEAETGRLLQDVAREALGDQIPLAVISGPTFAKELAAGLPTAISLASTDQTFADDLQQLLHCGKSFRVYSNPDFIGVQLGGAVKNVIAIGAGMSDGIGFGANAEFIWGYQNTELSNAGTSTPFNMWFNLPPSAGESNNTQYIYSYITYFVTDQWLKLFDGDETDYRASRLDKTEDVKDEDILDVSNDYAKYMLWHRTNNPDKMTKSKWAYNKFLHLGEQGETRADICLIRSSEMLLMMAEAAVHLDKIPEALNYLQTLQSARNVSKITTTTDKDELLEAIYIERRKELLGETVTGMFDNLRLQKDVIREGESLENNYAGHFNEGLLYWGSKAGNIATLKANDYRYFCQIPDIEFTRNKAISQDEQNPISGN